MCDREALLGAIRADPECDTARLVYADWLEERGEGGRANLIRRQVLKDHSPAVTYSRLMFELPGALWHSWQRGGGRSSKWVWTRGMVELGGALTVTRGFVSEIATTTVWFVGGIRGACDPCFGLGSPSGVAYAESHPCPACHGTGTFPGLASPLLSAHPIAAVTLTDIATRIEIDPPGEGYGWQAYFYRDEFDDYVTMNGYGENRADMITGLIADVREFAHITP